MKIRRQHYVWRYYLGPWTVDNQLYCLRDNKIFRTIPMNIAQTRDFYRLKELTADDIVHIEEFIKRGPEHLIPEHSNMVVIFNLLFNYLRNEGLSVSGDSEVERKIDVLVNNFQEDVHTRIENSGAEYVNMLRNKDLSFFKSKADAMRFMNFLCVQYMRTEKIKTYSIKATAHYETINTERIWNILSHITAMNISWSILCEFHTWTPVLLENETDTPFLTGDQPVINTRGTGTGLAEQVFDLEFYYPITPKIALLISQNPIYHTKKPARLTQEKVDEYNRHIVLGSHTQIFSSTEESLARIKNIAQAWRVWRASGDAQKNSRT
jgi:hypothetical protein